MPRKTLAEWIQVDVQTDAAEPHPQLVMDNSLAEWGGIAYAELSVLLAHLRFLAFAHQTHHWIAGGDSYFGDHKLFEELYNAIVAEIDDVGEKAVGLGSEHNVNLMLQMHQVSKLIASYGSAQTIPQASELAKRSLAVELHFLKTLSMMSAAMKESGTMTDGVENMLQQVADRHEKHVYLLKRRCSSAALGL